MRAIKRCRNSEACITAIDRATDPDWPSVKTRVEKDIGDAKKRISDLALVAKSKA